MKVLLLGPYIGDFKNEITTFRPYARWITEAIQPDKIYISSHNNRKFLYDWIPEDNFIPVHSHLTRDEQNQQGYINKDIDQKDYNIIVRKIRDEVFSREDGISKKDIIIESVPYVKTTIPISIYQKIFTSIKNESKKSNHILFIPDRLGGKNTNKTIFNFLRGEDLIVAGDHRCTLSEKNILFKNSSYIETVYKYIVDLVQSARLVITPCSHWTLLSNLQGIPVFSWCNNPGPYKFGGLYNFDNKNCHSIFYDKQTGINKLLSQLEWSLKKY